MKYDWKYIPKKIIFDFLLGIPFRFGVVKRAIGIDSKVYNNLKKLKGTYKGKRCFLIGTGPSLTMEDLELIKDEITFSMNSICLAFDKTNFRPTFYGIHDITAFHNYKNYIYDYKLENVFIGLGQIKEQDCEKDWIKFPLDNIYNRVEYGYGYKGKFSKNAYLRVYDGYTIAFSLLQIIYYMGFSEVYLLGIDCDYSVGSASNHFIEDSTEKICTRNTGRQMYVAYRSAVKFCKKHNFKIYNCSRGGKLDLFEKKKLEDVINIK